MMNSYLKCFLRRGLIFAGFGPIVAGIVLYIVSLRAASFSLSGLQILTAILSTYVLAFLQAGASVFNQIEHWPLPKSLLCHFSVLYFAYVGCYLMNSWIPFEPKAVIIFTLSFAVLYFIIWITVYICVKNTGKKFNEKLQ